MSFDMVEQPRHYALTGLEPIDVIEDWLAMWPYQCGFALANAVKYIARCGLKGTTEQDLDKAGWYVRRALRLERYVASDYSKKPTVTAQQAADSWENTWPEDVRDALREALTSLATPATRLSLSRAADAVSRASYLSRSAPGQLSFANIDTLVIGDEVRVKYSTDPSVKVGESVQLIDMLDSVPFFKVKCGDGVIRYVEDVEAA